MRLLRVPVVNWVCIIWLLRLCGCFQLCLRLFAVPLVCLDGPVAQWIRHRPTEQGIAGSSLAGVIAVWWLGFD